MTENICLIGPASAPIFEKPGMIELDALGDLPLILAGVRKEGIRREIEKALGSTRINLRVVAEVETMFVARRMVTRGLGYSINVASSVQELIEAGTLQARPMQGLSIQRVVARASDRQTSRAGEEVTRVVESILVRQNA